MLTHRRHTKPGGYFELQELDCRFTSDDGSLTYDSNLSYWARLITEAAEKYNRPIPRYTDYLAWFEKAGFVDIQQNLFKCPTNPWPKHKILKDAGKYQLLAHIEGLEAVSLGLLTRALNWKPEEVKVLMAKIRPELKSRAIHSYQYKVFITARKPRHTPPVNTNSTRLGNSAPPTPNSIGPSCPNSPAPPDQINAFTPLMPITNNDETSRRGLSVRDMVNTQTDGS
ncbi:MAG: hypothetical protein Q9183_001804 [Haloplaca sp. 2 TL-2023]